MFVSLLLKSVHINLKNPEAMTLISKVFSETTPPSHPTLCLRVAGKIVFIFKMQQKVLISLPSSLVLIRTFYFRLSRIVCSTRQHRNVPFYVFHFIITQDFFLVPFSSFLPSFYLSFSSLLFPHLSLIFYLFYRFILPIPFCFVIPWSLLFFVGTCVFFYIYNTTILYFIDRFFVFLCTEYNFQNWDRGRKSC